jgi:hypothetical protein
MRRDGAGRTRLLYTGGMHLYESHYTKRNFERAGLFKAVRDNINMDIYWLKVAPPDPNMYWGMYSGGRIQPYKTSRLEPFKCLK